jgi:hypothetical protein
MWNSEPVQIKSVQAPSRSLIECHRNSLDLGVANLALNMYGEVRGYDVDYSVNNKRIHVD